MCYSIVIAPYLHHTASHRWRSDIESLMRIGQIVANRLIPKSRGSRHTSIVVVGASFRNQCQLSAIAYSGSAQSEVEGYIARYYLLLSATPIPSFDISLIALPQIITTVDCRSISHIYIICRNFTPYYQFLSQKFGNFKGGG